MTNVERNRGLRKVLPNFGNDRSVKHFKASEAAEFLRGIQGDVTYLLRDQNLVKTILKNSGNMIISDTCIIDIARVFVEKGIAANKDLTLKAAKYANAVNSCMKEYRTNPQGFEQMLSKYDSNIQLLVRHVRASYDARVNKEVLVLTTKEPTVTNTNNVAFEGNSVINMMVN